MTGDENITKIHIEAALEQCTGIVLLNTTLQEAEPEISYQLTHLCPGNCSGNGHCNDGNCTCASGFAGSDCSFDTTGPPTITGTSYNLCDKNKQDCDALYFYGSYFLQNMGTTCHVKKTEINLDGSVRSSDIYTTDLQEQTLFLGSCELTNSSGGYWTTDYTMNITVDGERFTEAYNVTVYNSLCQQHHNDSGDVYFTLKSGYCFIQETSSCIADGAMDSSDYCKICDPTVNSFNWTFNAACIEQTSATESPITTVSTATTTMIETSMTTTTPSTAEPQTSTTATSTSTTATSTSAPSTTATSTSAPSTTATSTSTTATSTSAPSTTATSTTETPTIASSTTPSTTTTSSVAPTALTIPPSTTTPSMTVTTSMTPSTTKTATTTSKVVSTFSADTPSTSLTTLTGTVSLITSRTAMSLTTLTSPTTSTTISKTSSTTPLTTTTTSASKQRIIIIVSSVVVAITAVVVAVIIFKKYCLKKTSTADPGFFDDDIQYPDKPDGARKSSLFINFDPSNQGDMKSMFPSRPPSATSYHSTSVQKLSSATDLRGIYNDGFKDRSQLFRASSPENMA